MIDNLRKILKAQPFQPFRIHMNDGRHFDVRHPEMALLSRSFIDIGVPPDEEVPDRIEMLQLRNISSVERLAEMPDSP